MAAAVLTALLLAAVAPAPPPPAPDFGSIFADWRTIGAEALRREREAAEARRAPERTVVEARSLGERVGRIVAEGDCAEGERLARAAGDFPLLEAVRDHCRAVPASTR